MAFQGGSIPTLGITSSYLAQLGTVTGQTGASLALGQVWQGAGQSFYGKAGQALVGNLAGSAVNIALNTKLGTQVPGPGGFNLTSGANILASTVTPFVTGALAAGINQSINQSLQSAGPFGSILSQVGTSLATQAFQGIGNAIFGPAAGGLSQSYKTFPGAGNEPAANYAGGNSYTLGPNGSDVVFSLQPANKGPQSFGLSQIFSDPKSITTLPFSQLTKMPLLAGNETANTLKAASMQNSVTQKAFSTNLSKNFNTKTRLF